MVGVKTKLTPTPQRLETATKKAAFNSFFHGAASIRISAQESIVQSNTPGPPGGPIRSKLSNKRRRKSKSKRKRKRQSKPGLAIRSILFRADRDGAVIGFAASKIGQAMEAHEHGKSRGGVKFPQRPTIQPALERSLARFHREWRGAIS